MKKLLIIAAASSFLFIGCAKVEPTPAAPDTQSVQTPSSDITNNNAKGKKADMSVPVDEPATGTGTGQK